MLSSRTTRIIAGIVVLILLVGGGYLLLHSSSDNHSLKPVPAIPLTKKAGLFPRQITTAQSTTWRQQHQAGVWLGPSFRGMVPLGDDAINPSAVIQPTITYYDRKGVPAIMFAPGNAQPAPAGYRQQQQHGITFWLPPKKAQYQQGKGTLPVFIRSGTGIWTIINTTTTSPVSITDIIPYVKGIS